MTTEDGDFNLANGLHLGTSIYPLARSRSVRLQVGRIDHDGPGLRPSGSKAVHHSTKHVHLASLQLL